MKNIVSFETAKHLKDAGFPQPEPEVGQFWYSGFMPEWLCVVTYEKGEQNLFLCPIENVGWRHYFFATLSDNEAHIFAPTATDILQHLPGHNIEFWQPQGIFYVENESGVQWVSENPAEAAAAAWLALHEE